MRILTLSEDTKKDILTNLLKRSPNSYGEYEGRVAAIIDDIKARRDEAVFEYTKKFDGYDLNSENILVTDEEIKAAYDEIDPKLVDIIRKALVNIRDYHAKQKRNSWFDANEKGNHPRTENHPFKESRCICSRRKSSLSIIGSYECCTGKGGRR